jgi:hypothetical protein
MNYRIQLLKEHSKKNSLLIVDYIGGSQERFDEFITHFFTDEYRVNQRSAMVVSACFDQHPHLLTKHIKRIIKNLEDRKLHVALKRNSIRILQEMQIPEELMASLFDSCIGFIIDPLEPIAVKAFSMKVCVNICRHYPELKQELIPVIEDSMTHSESMGIHSRGKAMLKQLHKL